MWMCWWITCVDIQSCYSPLYNYLVWLWLLGFVKPDNRNIPWVCWTLASGLIILSRPSSRVVTSPTTLNASALQCRAQWQRSSCSTLLIQSTVSINGLHQAPGFKSHRLKKKLLAFHTSFYITSPMGPSFKRHFVWLGPVVMSAGVTTHHVYPTHWAQCSNFYSGFFLALKEALMLQQQSMPGFVIMANITPKPVYSNFMLV